MTAPIVKFEEEYRFLSNFWPARIKRNYIDDDQVPSLQVVTWVSFPSVEHAYQASKCVDIREASVFLEDTPAGFAKKMGAKVKLRPDWEVCKDAVMEHWVRRKFQNTELSEKLLATGDAELIEGNTWGDRYWGVCNGIGQNKLGKILMKIRAEHFEIAHRAMSGGSIKKEETMITKVININDAPGGRRENAAWKKDPQYVYCGRAGQGLEGPWGNPHPVGRPCPVCSDQDADDFGEMRGVTHAQGEAVEAFRKDFNTAVLFPDGQWGFKSVETLRGKTLVCFCFPKPCHCDVPAQYLNAKKDEPQLTIPKLGEIQRNDPHQDCGGECETKPANPLDRYKGKICAVTGHRPQKLGGFGDGVFEKLVIYAELVLKKMEPTKVITGMALGWDQAVATACVNLKIPYAAYTPGIWQPLKWPTEAQDRYRDLIEMATEVHNCDPNPGSGYAAWKLQSRNEQMVDNCQLLLALWDGSGGGTGNCVDYAAKQGRARIMLWDKWQKGGW